MEVDHILLNEIVWSVLVKLASSVSLRTYPVWEAMRTMKNGKAGCPTEGLVNELLKYGGMHATRVQKTTIYHQ